MFGRRRKETGPPSAARAALADPEFACRVPGVRALHVDYDPAVWTRLPHEGEDRTDWAAAHLAAYAEDLSLTAADPAYAVAQKALNIAANTLLTHTADWMALPHPELGPGTTAYVDVVDAELGLLEHNDPETFLTMADLRPERPAKVRWYPIKRSPQALRYSSESSVDLETWERDCVLRAHRVVARDPGDTPVLEETHLYSSAFSSKSVAPALQLVRWARLETTDGRTL